MRVRSTPLTNTKGRTGLSAGVQYMRRTLGTLLLTLHCSSYRFLCKASMADCAHQQQLRNRTGSQMQGRTAPLENFSNGAPAMTAQGGGGNPRPFSFILYRH